MTATAPTPVSALCRAVIYLSVTTNNKRDTQSQASLSDATDACPQPETTPSTARPKIGLLVHRLLPKVYEACRARRRS
jgi:4-alpha-glucanotransferase